jgi:hypothetical protein
MFVISSEYLDWFIKGLNVRFLEVRVLLNKTIENWVKKKETIS